MSYIIAIVIVIAVLIASVFLVKILVIFIAKKLAVSLAKKAVKHATQYAKDQIQTLTEKKRKNQRMAINDKFATIPGTVSGKLFQKIFI